MSKLLFSIFKKLKMSKIVNILLIILIFLSYCNISESAYIYAYLLHNPIPDESISSSLTDKLFADEALNQTKEVKLRCKQDIDCGIHSELYCDLHYGHCDSLHEEGELCRRDGQCMNGLICIFGKCEVPVKDGHKGSRCNNSNDCKPHLCCARQHGEKICKSKLQRGHRCFVPLGGLDYSLNELCPCEDGLTCSKRKFKKRKGRHWRSEIDQLRCTPANDESE